MSRVPGFLTVREAKKELHMWEGTVRLLIREGKIRAVKQGKVTRIPVEEVERWKGRWKVNFQPPIKEYPRATGRLAKALEESP